MPVGSPATTGLTATQIGGWAMLLDSVCLHDCASDCYLTWHVYVTPTATLLGAWVPLCDSTCLRDSDSDPARGVRRTIRRSLGLSIGLKRTKFCLLTIKPEATELLTGIEWSRIRDRA